VTQDTFGATPAGDDRWRFVVWAPYVETVDVAVLDDDRRVRLERDAAGYHRGAADRLRPGARYRLVLDGDRALADPASRRQPEGVHGPSALDDPGAFAWSDPGWGGRTIDDYVLYEVHIGAFTAEGTFDAAIERLDDVASLGATAVELMPASPFPGERNWGYDGVFPYGVHESYGGPDGLRRFVDACHARGLAVVLDVVHNHQGPEGNVFAAFGPYFTNRYPNPWGDAVNVDGPGSDDVRRFLLGSVRMWLRDFHFDGLRLDAIPTIVDTSAVPFLAELTAEADAVSAETGRALVVIAESDANDRRVVTPRDRDGLGMDAQWVDDLHRSLHAFLTGERFGYDADFGSLGDVAATLRRGWALDGRPSVAHGRRWGSSPVGLPGHAFIAFTQNHDQVGNRPNGERLSDLVDLETYKLAAATALLSPFVPLLFMGEEYGELAPFPFFTDFSDPAVERMVRDGRRSELAAWGFAEDPCEPQALETFLAATLDHRLRQKEPHRRLLALYTELLRARRDVPALRRLDPSAAQVELHGETIVHRRLAAEGDALVVLAFGDDPIDLAPPAGRWLLRLDTADERYAGPGSRALAVAARPDPIAMGRRSATLWVQER
jgi:maltooligosyltrehalose trehalohydrolase